MWLLHAQTFELRSFASAHVAPRYAILSHCWDDDEVTFVDIQELTRAQSKRGWLKVSNACSVALLQHNCQWIWIDTCCIDKSSSNELSEAINSMFDWYKWAHICLAYLGDLVDLDPSTQLLSFGRSRWFTRGWTLQELIAPNPKMVFYTATWVQIGTRSMLGDVIVRVTGINRSILWTQYDPGTLNLSIATRMSWAVGRQTTRPEDRAYSLMGLFGIKMPVIYGEGEEAAFLRLQLEIIRRSDDHTIFAWGLNDPYRTRLDRFDRPQVELKDVQSVGDIAGTSLLAPSLDAFRGSGDFDPISIGLLAQVLNLPRLREPHFYDTNMGIRIQLPIRELHQRAPATPPVLYVAALPCHIGAEKQVIMRLSLWTRAFELMRVLGHGINEFNQTDRWAGLVLQQIDPRLDIYRCVSVRHPRAAPGRGDFRVVDLDLSFDRKIKLGRRSGWKWRMATIYIRV